MILPWIKRHASADREDGRKPHDEYSLRLLENGLFYLSIPSFLSYYEPRDTSQTNAPIATGAVANEQPRTVCPEQNPQVTSGEIPGKGRTAVVLVQGKSASFPRHRDLEQRRGYASILVTGINLNML